MEVTITVTGYDADRMVEAVVERLQERLVTQVQTAFDDRVRGQIDDLVAAVGSDRIEAAVEKALAEGWQSTNTYGEPVGKRVGLKERVGEILTKREGYGSDSTTYVDKLVKQSVDLLMRAEFGKEIASARDDLRKALNDAVKEKLATAVKGAFGIAL